MSVWSSFQIFNSFIVVYDKGSTELPPASSNGKIYIYKDLVYFFFVRWDLQMNNIHTYIYIYYIFGPPFLFFYFFTFMARSARRRERERGKSVDGGGCKVEGDVQQNPTSTKKTQQSLLLLTVASQGATVLNQSFSSSFLFWVESCALFLGREFLTTNTNSCELHHFL